MKSGAPFYTSCGAWRDRISPGLHDEGHAHEDAGQACLAPDMLGIA
jgi:hypothetical protein